MQVNYTLLIYVFVSNFIIFIKGVLQYLVHGITACSINNQEQY
jgi:hypothetical protein